MWYKKSVALKNALKYSLSLLLIYFSSNLFAQVNCTGVIDSSKTEMCIANGAVTFSNASASGEKIEWITSGDGVFNDRFSQKPTYIPGAQDSANGYVFIYLDVYKDDTINYCSILPVMTLHLGTMNTVATPAYQTACANISITNLFFSSSLASTTYMWTRDNYPLVGGSIQQTGTTNSVTPIKGTLVNNTADPILVTFTATPSAGTCQGTPVTAKILVNPKATATPNPSTQTVCSGSNITSITFSSQANGTTFSWTRDKTDSVTGIPASGTGSVSGTLINKNTVPVTVKFTIIPNANGCNGSPYTATVTVNPTATAITTAPALQTICSGTAIGTIISSGGIAGTVYNWARNNTTQATGIASSGSGNITGTLTNTTNAPVKVTFTVTPSSSSCANRSTVIVNPKPVAVATPANQVVCSGYSIAPIQLTSLVKETSFTWTRNNTGSVTGVAASGSGNIIGTLLNTTNAPVVVTFTIIPTANGCTGNPITATVTVNPRPTSFISGNYDLCIGQPLPAININFTGTGPWNFTYSEGNSPVTVTNHSSNIFSFVAPPQPCTFKVTALSDAYCIALPEDMTGSAVLTQQEYIITSTSGANGIITSSDTLAVKCGADKSYAITPNSGFNIQDVLVDGVSQGAIPAYTFTNVTAPHTISATFVAAAGCSVPTIVTSVTNVVCKNSSTGAVIINTTGGTGPFTYSWTGPNSFNSNLKDLTGLPAGTYTLTVTATGSCSTQTSITITEPLTGLTATANAGTIACAGGTTTLTVTATGGSGTRQYSLNGGVYQTSNTFIVNAAGSPYTVTVKDTSACTANTNTVVVAEGTSLPAQPALANGQIFNLCGGGTFTYTIAAVAGATSYTWGTTFGGTIVSGQGTTQVQVTVPSTFTGTGTIFVTPRNACGNGTQYRFSVYAILYYSSSADIAGPTSVTSGQTNIQYSVPNVAGVSYNWTVPSRVIIKAGQGTNTITVDFGPYGGNIGVATTNACGTSPRMNKTVSIVAAKTALTSVKQSTNELVLSPSLNVYPNPTHGIATVTFNSQMAGQKFEIVISNSVGETLTRTSGVSLSGKNMLEVALGKFSAGVYLVRLITTGNTQSKKLMLEK